MNLVTESPSWFVVFCILAGIAYAGVLYFRNIKLKDFPLWTVRLIALLRFTCITILSFFLLSPLLETVNRKLEKPIIVFAQDVSESIVIGKDSSAYRNAYLKNLKNFREQLNDKYETYFYSFSDKIERLASIDSIRFTGKQTDISALFEEIETRYSNRNVGAVILASDGLYNKGASPVYASEKIKTPLYTIAMGDTTIQKDLILLKVEQNRMAYLGNEFPLRVVVNAKQLKGKATILKVKQGNNVLFEQTININSEEFITTVPVLLEAKKIGLQRYRVSLSSMSEEVSSLNNSQNVFMDVLDARQKVLLLAHAPHPDVAAIKETIAANDNYEVEAFTIEDFKKSVKGYNLIILHQIPNASNASTRIVGEIQKSNVPVWVFSGANTILKKGLRIVSSTSKTNDSEVVLNENFPLFTLSEAFRAYAENFPAIVCPYGDYVVNTNSTALFNQRIGVVETNTPIMAFTNSDDNRSAIFYGEGIWKWRINDFSTHGNTDLFDEFIYKTVQYLSVKENKSFFKLNYSKSFLENENIIINAEVYNQSYELINEPEVSISITNFGKNKFPFTFSKTSDSYRLNAGRLPVGDYKFEATVKVGTSVYTKQGGFRIVALQVESVNSIADHQLLYKIAKKHGGELLYPNQLDDLVEKLNNRDDIKTIAYTQNKLSDLIHYKWIFYLLLTLLSLEWFIRKRNGAY